MGSNRQRGLFDFEDRMREIGAKDPLARLHEVVDWEAFRGPIGSGPKAEVTAVEATPRITGPGAKRNKPVTAEQKAENKVWAKIRSRVEHVIGDQHTGMHLTKIRTRRKSRAEFTIRLNKLAYNLRRLGFLRQQSGFATG